MNFNLMYQHHFSLTELENMLPYEREFYTLLLEQHLRADKEHQQRVAT